MTRAIGTLATVLSLVEVDFDDGVNTVVRRPGALSLGAFEGGSIDSAVCNLIPMLSSTAPVSSLMGPRGGAGG
jgi:hypothetical protein